MDPVILEIAVLQVDLEWKKNFKIKLQNTVFFIFEPLLAKMTFLVLK
jgi:hypothetical protein